MKFLYALLFLPIICFGQDNFLKTKTYKIATTASINQPTTAQANQSTIYYDGLGRPIQQIQNKTASTGNDIILHKEYEADGFESKKYLPYASGGNTMAYDPSALSNTLNYSDGSFTNYTGQNPYYETTRQSETGNILSQAAPGLDFAKGSGHEIVYDPYYPSSSIAPIKIYKAQATWNSSSQMYTTVFSQNGTSNYIDGDLYVMVTKNENWIPSDGVNNTKQEFVGKDGKTILVRKFESGIAHNTYYVYDQFGNLTYVLPPNVSSATTQLDDLCYQYRYDHRNRVVEKKVPGKAWEFIVYDKLNRPVATGPALSPFSDLTNQGWLVTKYDIFDRIVYTGWLNSTVSSAARATMQTTQNNAVSNFSETKQTSGTIDGIAAYYSTVSTPTGIKLLTVNYYDNYVFPDAPSSIPTTVLSDASQAVFYNNTNNLPKGILTGKWTRVLETSTATNSEKEYYLYDNQARQVRLYKKNYLGGFTQVDTKIDFAGKILTVERSHKRLSTSDPLTAKEVFTYDNQDRLQTHTHQINNNPVQLLSEKTYSKLGALVSEKVGRSSSNPMQVVNYAYNLRGWLTDINNVQNLTVSGNPQDLFSLKLNYNDVDTTTALVSEEQYNGNVSEVFWKTNSDNTLRKYSYTYDDLDRLESAVYQKPDITDDATNSYNESVTYDMTGNIQTLLRKGEYDDNGGLTLDIDNLTYAYHPTVKNQLMRVTDSTNSSAGFKNGTNTDDDYSYDVLGNMVTDKNKGITTAIKYNHINLPTEINFSASPIKKVTYLYDANGNKLKKVQTQGTTVTTTEYFGDFQYQDNVLQFFTTAQGYVRATTDGSGTSFNYVFNYLDHLGNVRLSYGLDTDGVTTKILEESNYYPFGLKHRNYNWSQFQYIKFGGGTVVAPCATCNYNYKFNGKEYQEEFGHNVTAMDFRQYDNALGRFTVIDPMAEIDFDISPYSFVRNNPVGYSDPSGLCPECEENIEDPYGGQLYYSSGGATYEFDEIAGAWNRIDGGDLEEVVIITGKDYDKTEGPDYESYAYEALDIIIDFTPASGIKDMYQGYKNGNGWQVALGAVSLTVDIFTLGGGSLVKGAVKTAAKEMIVKEGIYEFVAASGKIYVGQSVNIPARLAQHIKSGKLAEGVEVMTREVLGGKTSREIAEQLRINELGGIFQNGEKVLENFRNPIGEARQYLLK